MRKIYFHEDDYCQLEVLPLSAEQFCRREMGEIEEFAEEHREGPFYTDIYLREESPETLLQLNLRPEQLTAALDFLPAYDLVETGYSSYREECQSTQARGLNEELAVFWSVDEAGLVEAIWLAFWVEPQEANAARQLLTALGHLAPLLLADWSWDRCVDLRQPAEIEQYVAEKVLAAQNWRDELAKMRLSETEEAENGD